MACCPKEYTEECEILVCVDAPAPHNPNFYNCLRFGLLASSWLPIPLGIFLWSALHVMLLIVGGPVNCVIVLLITYVWAVGVIGYVFVNFSSICVVVVLIAVAANLVLLLVESMRFCWSLVVFLACHETTVEWRGGACLTVEFWKGFLSAVRQMLWAFVPIAVPCVNSNRSIYERYKDLLLETWARWCEEVVHKHDAIAL